MLLEGGHCPSRGGVPPLFLRVPWAYGSDLASRKGRSFEPALALSLLQDFMSCSENCGTIRDASLFAGRGKEFYTYEKSLVPARRFPIHHR